MKEKLANFFARLRSFQFFKKKELNEATAIIDVGDSATTFVPYVHSSSALEKKGDLDFYTVTASVVLSAYFLADLGSIGIQKALTSYFPQKMASSHLSQNPQATRTQDLNEYAAIWDRYLFNHKGFVDKPPPPPPDPPVRTSLPWNLIGVIILEDQIHSVGTIEDKTTQMVYPVQVGDSIPGVAKITKIEKIGNEPGKVHFLNLQTNRNEFIDLPDDGAGFSPVITVGKKSKGDVKKAKPASAGTARFNVPKAEVEAAMSNLNLVLTQARAIPNMENGQPNGFKLIQIVPGSIYDKIGIKENDVITCLNGEEINDAGKAIELLGQLREASHLELCVRRGGQDTTHVYDIN